MGTLHKLQLSESATSYGRETLKSQMPVLGLVNVEIWKTANF